MVLIEPRRMAMRTFAVPDIDDESFLLKVHCVTICGGDPIEYEGRNIKARYPMILGHEMTGTIEKIGDRAARRYGVDIGDRVSVEPYIVCGECQYCLTGYYQFCSISRVYGVNITCDDPPHLWGACGEYLYGAPGSRVHKIDSRVTDEAAALASVLGNGVRWIRTKAQVRFGESIAILGAGAQGLATVIAASEAGASRIIVVGREANRLKWALATEFGAHDIVDLDAVDDPVARVLALNDGRLVDVVVECTGAEAMMQLGLELIRPVGRYVMVGTCGFGRRSLTTDLVVFKEIQVLGGLGQSWDTEEAVRVINSRKYPIEKMVTHVFRLAEADEAIRFFMAHPEQAIRVAIQP